MRLQRTQSLDDIPQALRVPRPLLPALRAHEAPDLAAGACVHRDAEADEDADGDFHRQEGDFFRRPPGLRGAWTPLEMFKKQVLADAPVFRQLPEAVFDMCVDAIWRRMSGAEQDPYWSAHFRLRRRFEGAAR